MVLVGTKKDLRDDKDNQQAERITPTEGSNVSNENGFVDYLECSVFNEKKRAMDLKMVFDTAVRAVLTIPTEKKKKKSKCVML